MMWPLEPEDAERLIKSSEGTNNRLFANTREQILNTFSVTAIINNFSEEDILKSIKPDTVQRIFNDEKSEIVMKEPKDMTPEELNEFVAARENPIGYALAKSGVECEPVLEEIDISDKSKAMDVDTFVQKFLGKEKAAQIKADIKSRSIAMQLSILRGNAGYTIEQFAKMVAKPTDVIREIENKVNEDITITDISLYLSPKLNVANYTVDHMVEPPTVIINVMEKCVPKYMTFNLVVKRND